MKRRIVTALLLLALALQGPVVAYAAVLGPLAGGSAGSASCVPLVSLTDCDSCCSSGAGPSCSASCVLSAGAALPAHSTLAFPKARGVPIPDPATLPYAGHSPARALRPPIV